RAPTAPPLPSGAVPDRGLARGRPVGELKPPRRPTPAAGAGDVPFVAHFVTPRNMKRRKPVACLLSACRRKSAARVRGRIAQRGGGGAVGGPMRSRGRRASGAPGWAAPTGRRGGGPGAA